MHAANPAINAIVVDLSAQAIDGQTEPGSTWQWDSGLFDPNKIYEVWYDATGSKVIGIDLMQGLIDLVSKRYFPVGSKVLYAHLGGAPALNGYSYAFRNG
jgi:hypothetical protein